MSKQRYVDTKFWDDSYILTLDTNEKLLYIYLLTNPLTNICGIYEISITRMAFDTEIDRGKVILILQKFKKAKRLQYSREGYIAIRKFIKHQAKNSKIRKGIESLLKKAPKRLVQWVEGYPIDSSSRDIDSPSHLNPNVNFNYKEGKFEGLKDEYLLGLIKKYPMVDVAGQILKMTDWLIDNPQKKRQGKRSFIIKWLDKEKSALSGKQYGLQKLPQGKDIK